MRPLAALALVLLAPHARPQTLADALRASVKPILATDLPDGYRAVALGNDGMGSASSLMVYGMASGRSSEDAASQMLFGLMGTTFVDPDEFAALLDGKRPRIKGYVLDLQTMLAQSKGSAAIPTPLFSETWIEGGRIVQWSPRPGLTKAALVQVFGKPDVPGDSASDRARGLSNVKQVATALILYSSDYDDVFPYAHSTAEAQEQVYPYTKNRDLWKSPNGGRVLYNTALSGVSQTALESPAETLMVWEEKAYPDGSRAVGYTDGHAARRDTAQWEAAWRAELARRAKAKAATPRIRVRASASPATPGR